VISWDFNTATLTAIGLQVVLLIAFLVRTHTKANGAHELALKIETKQGDFDDRLRKIEAEHVLGMALRQDFREFQASISKQFSDLRNERREDMRGLHSRLNEILVAPPRGAE